MFEREKSKGWAINEREHALLSEREREGEGERETSCLRREIACSIVKQKEHLPERLTTNRC